MISGSTRRSTRPPHPCVRITRTWASTAFPATTRLVMILTGSPRSEYFVWTQTVMEDAIQHPCLRCPTGGFVAKTRTAAPGEIRRRTTLAALKLAREFGDRDLPRLCPSLHPSRHTSLLRLLRHPMQVPRRHRLSLLRRMRGPRCLCGRRCGCHVLPLAAPLNLVVRPGTRLRYALF